MKYAGVDGVMIDWYGVQGTNGDIGNLLTNSNAIVDKVDDFGLEVRRRAWRTASRPSAAAT